MTHRATETEPTVENRRKLFSEHNLPHIAMGILFVTWVAFQLPMFNGGATPTTINVAFAGTLGLWFPYLIKTVTGDSK